MKKLTWILLVSLIIFIFLPIISLIKESVIGNRPWTPEEYKVALREIIPKIPAQQKKDWTDNWLTQFDDSQKLDLYLGSLKKAEIKTADYSSAPLTLQQTELMIQSLRKPQKDRFEETFYVELFYLKRIPLFFKIKPFIDQEQLQKIKQGSVKTFTLEHYRKFFGTPYLRGSLIRSFKVSIVSMILTVFLAYIFAYAINRTTCRFKAYFNAMALFPLVSPPIIMGFSLILLFGRQGVVTKELLDETLHLINAATFNIYGMHGIILSQIFTFLPVAFVMLHSVLVQLDTRLEEAAENLGASKWYTFSRVTLPMSYPGLFQAMLVVFILAMQDFGNPRIIGSEYTMVAGVMYDQMVGFQNSNMAAVLGVMLLVPTILAYITANVWLGRKTYATREPSGILYIKETPKAFKITLETTCFAVSTLILLLYLTIIAGSFVNVWGVDNTLTFKYYTSVGITGASFMEADVGNKIGLPLVLSSVKTMGIAAIIGGFLAIVIAYVIERQKGFLSRIIGFIVLIPVALPGVIFGIGYIISFNAPLGMPMLALTGTTTIILLLIIFTRLYAGVMSTQSVLQKTDYSVEEAAMSLGAGRFYTFRHIVFPALKRPWLLGTLYIFVSGLVALGGVIFLISARQNLASVAIYLLTEQGKFGLSCAMSTYLIIIVVIVMSAIRYIEREDRYAKAIRVGKID
jgi:iron(III) transport system permease protein